MDVLDFNSLINQLLDKNELPDKISKNKNEFFFLEISTLIEHQPTNEFLDSPASNSIIPYILQPTRFTGHSKTLIDIFSKCTFM